MLEKVQYRNHLGEVVSFGENGLFVNENDLRDFLWSYTNKNNRISAFGKGVVKKTLQVIIACDSETEGIAKRNALFETCEKDVLAKKHGRIFIGDYYMRCYVVGSKKTEYLRNNRFMKVKLTIATEYPTWIREKLIPFRMSNSPFTPGVGGQNHDYPYDYFFDYGSDIATNAVKNEDFASSNFRIVIYGSCINPEIYIAGHVYNVNTEIAANEYLVINSGEKTIELVRSNGEKVNCFNSRNRDSYVFERIPPGASNVMWDGSFGFDVTLLEERSEPRWT